MPQLQRRGCRPRTNVPELHEVILLASPAGLAVFRVLHQLRHHIRHYHMGQNCACERDEPHAQLLEGLDQTHSAISTHAYRLRRACAEPECTMLRLPRAPTCAAPSGNDIRMHVPSGRCCSRRWVWRARAAARGPASARVTSSRSLQARARQTEECGAQAERSTWCMYSAVQEATEQGGRGEGYR